MTFVLGVKTNEDELLHPRCIVNLIYKKCRCKACASEQNIKTALMFYRERSQGSPKAVRLRNFGNRSLVT